jgi:type I restriction enzyme R subunit
MAGIERDNPALEDVLRKHDYPPDKQEKATETVLEQAALLSEVWAAA